MNTSYSSKQSLLFHTEPSPRSITNFPFQNMNGLSDSRIGQGRKEAESLTTFIESPIGETPRNIRQRRLFTARRNQQQQMIQKRQPKPFEKRTVQDFPKSKSHTSKRMEQRHLPQAQRMSSERNNESSPTRGMGPAPYEYMKYLKTRKDSPTRGMGKSNINVIPISVDHSDSRSLRTRNYNSPSRGIGHSNVIETYSAREVCNSEVLSTKNYDSPTRRMDNSKVNTNATSWEVSDSRSLCTENYDSSTRRRRNSKVNANDMSNEFSDSRSLHTRNNDSPTRGMGYSTVNESHSTREVSDSKSLCTEIYNHPTKGMGNSKVNANGTSGEFSDSRSLCTGNYDRSTREIPYSKVDANVIYREVSNSRPSCTENNDSPARGMGKPKFNTNTTKDQSNHIVLSESKLNSVSKKKYLKARPKVVSQVLDHKRGEIEITLTAPMTSSNESNSSCIRNNDTKLEHQTQKDMKMEMEERNLIHPSESQFSMAAGYESNTMSEVSSLNSNNSDSDDDIIITSEFSSNQWLPPPLSKQKSINRISMENYDSSHPPLFVQQNVRRTKMCEKDRTKKEKYAKNLIPHDGVMDNQNKSECLSSPSEKKLLRKIKKSQPNSLIGLTNNLLSQKKNDKESNILKSELEKNISLVKKIYSVKEEEPGLIRSRAYYGNNSLENEDKKSVHSTKTMKSINTAKTSRSCSSFTVRTQCTNSSITQEKLEERARANRMNQRKIRMLHHALTCNHPPPPFSLDNGDDEEDLIMNYEFCPKVKYCYALITLVKHAQTCPITKKGEIDCEVPGCAAYKNAWNHYRRCMLNRFGKSGRSCRFCSDIWIEDSEINIKDSEEKASEVEEDRMLESMIGKEILGKVIN